MKNKELLIYTAVFILAFVMFLGYVAWKDSRTNTLPEVYGVR